MAEIHEYQLIANNILEDLRQANPKQAMFNWLIHQDSQILESQLLGVEVLHRLGFVNKADKILKSCQAKFPDQAQNMAFFLRLLAEQAKFNNQPPLQEYYLRRILALEPNNAKHYYNLTLKLLQNGNFTDAESLINIGKSCPNAKPEEFAHLQAYYYLYQGDGARGYALYAPDTNNSINMIYQLSQSKKWHGENHPNSSLGVMGVYGLGDVLGYCRYFADLREFFHGKLIGFFRGSLVELIKNQGIFDEVYGYGDDDHQQLPRTDYLIMAHHLSSIITTQAPKGFYLKLSDKKSQYWREKVKNSAQGKKSVGIVWTRNPNDKEIIFDNNDMTRSINIADFAPLINHPDIQVYSLLNGTESLKNPSYPPILRQKIIDYTDECHNIDDAAHLCVACDFVVSVCTMMINLCGAIGKDATVLLHNDHGYPWGDKNGAHSWYPNIQRIWVDENGWQSAIAQMMQNWGITANGE